MGRVSISGFNSPFNTDRVIKELLKIERRPIQRFNQRIDQSKSIKSAFKELETKVSSFQDSVEPLTSTDTFIQKTATSSDEGVLTASISSPEEASEGSFDVFVEQLATAPQVKSGQFINNQKMVDTAHTGSDGESATSISDFEQVEGGSNLDTSSDFLGALSKQVQTSEGTGNGDANEFSITVDPGTADSFTVGVDLDDFSNFQDLIDHVNNQLANNDPTGNQRLRFRYDEQTDRFLFVPLESSDNGGTTFELNDNEGAIDDSSQGFLQQIGIAEDETAHTFDETQSQFEDDGTNVPRNLLSIDPDRSFNDNLFSSQLAQNSGTIRINNTEINFDTNSSSDEVSTINELVSRIDDKVSGINATFNEATDKITLESENKGSGEIDVADVDGNLADVLNLRTESAAGGGQVAGDETSGQDAKFKIDGDVITSSDNKVGFNGMTLTAKQAHPDDGTNDPITIGVERDDEGIQKDVKNFVDKFNSVIKFINSKNDVKAPDEVGGEGNPFESGPFLGDTTVQSIRNRLTETVTSRFNTATSSGNDIQSLADVGIELVNPLESSDQTRGTLNFDADQFQQALEDHPDQVREIFTAEAGNTERGGDQDGVALQLDAFLKDVVGTNGLLPTRQSGIQDRIERLQERIDETEERVQAKKEQLERKFREMERLLGQFQAQQSFIGRRL